MKMMARRNVTLSHKREGSQETSIGRRPELILSNPTKGGIG